MVAGKVDRQPAYILHARPYRETSLLLEVLTPGHGRLALVARGARRPRAELRGLLLPFQPLTLSWFGKNEVRTLHKADWQGGVRQLSGQALICGFYVNELMLHLVAREDPAGAVWMIYDQTIRSLAQEPGQSVALRRFELGLIRALGYAPELLHDDQQQPIHPDAYYRLCPGQWPVLADAAEPGDRQALVAGRSLLAMVADDFSSELTRREARAMLRVMLTDLLGPDAQLVSRALLQTLSACPGSLSDLGM